MHPTLHLRPLPVVVSALVAMTLTTSPAAEQAQTPAIPIANSAVTELAPGVFDDVSRPPDVSFAYKQVAGLELPMAVFLPKDRASLAERRPVVIGIHGGAWSGWRGGDCGTWDGGVFAPHARYVAARGAVGVTISYRNVIQPGKDPAGFAAGPGLPDLLSDCRSAVRYLRQHADRFGLDPTRIAVIGDSAGGHLAACLGTIDRYDAFGEDRAVSGLANLVIACNPITDLTDPKWQTYIKALPESWEADHPLSLAERAQAVSPLWNVTPTSAPTLVLHGLKDGVVDPRHSIQFHEALGKAGVRSEIGLIEGASHAFVLLGYRSTGSEFLAVMRTVDHFLTANGYFTGPAVIAAPAPRGRLTVLPGDQIVAGRIPGSEGCALVLPDGPQPMVTVVEDAQHGRVLRFSKKNTGVSLTGHHELGVASTVSLWLQPEHPTGTGTLVRRSVGTNAATGYVLAFGKSGELIWKVAGATLTAGVLSSKEWSHVVASLAADRAALYLNGKLVAEQPLHDAALIGSHLTVGEGFAGLMADLRLFDTAVDTQAATAP